MEIEASVDEMALHVINIDDARKYVDQKKQMTNQYTQYSINATVTSPQNNSKEYLQAYTYKVKARDIMQNSVFF